MAFRIKYQKLFEVELRQNYCLNSGAAEFASLSEDEQQAMLATYRKTYSWLDDFALVATPETRRLMAGLGMLCKTTSTGFFMATEVEETAPETFTPKRGLDAPLRLRFALRLKAPAFMNYTNLSLSGHARKIYYFSNRPTEANRSRQQGNRRVFPFLSLEPPAFRNGTAYKAGDLVRRRNNVRTITLALRDGTHARPPSDTTGSLDWRRLVGRGYVNRNDRISLYRSVFNFTFAPETVRTASFTLIDPEDTSFFYGIDAEDQPFFSENPADLAVFSAAPGASLPQVQVDFRARTPGRYRLEVDGLDTGNTPYTQTEEIYLDSELSTQKVFGLVEIFHRAGNQLGDYRLLDNADRLRQPFYLLQFLNRYTFWRYRFATAPEHAPNPTDFAEVDALEYVTRASFPLTKSFIELDDDEGNPLPNPSARLIRPEGDGRVYSEVYLLHN